MKAIIDRKIYNTETAKKLAEYCSHFNYFQYYEEELFETKKGSFFIAGKGNAMSKYSQPSGDNSQGPSSHITVINKNEAIEWLERNNFVQELEEHFGDEIEEA